MALAMAVLIETLWNVNKSSIAFETGRNAVLIETLWNVNFATAVAVVRALSINRNIVECKSVERNVLSFVRSGINRNIVECKYDFPVSERF